MSHSDLSDTSSQENCIICLCEVNNKTICFPVTYSTCKCKYSIHLTCLKEYQINKCLICKNIINYPKEMSRLRMKHFKNKQCEHINQSDQNSRNIIITIETKNETKNENNNEANRQTEVSIIDAEVESDIDSIYENIYMNDEYGNNIDDISEFDLPVDITRTGQPNRQNRNRNNRDNRDNRFLQYLRRTKCTCAIIIGTIMMGGVFALVWYLSHL